MLTHFLTVTDVDHEKIRTFLLQLRAAGRPTARALLLNLCQRDSINASAARASL